MSHKTASVKIHPLIAFAPIVMIDPSRPTMPTQPGFGSKAGVLDAYFLGEEGRTRIARPIGDQATAEAPCRRSLVV
jgi:hypothetical protein